MKATTYLIHLTPQQVALKSLDLSRVEVTTV
jgi:hypothetical protein